MIRFHRLLLLTVCSCMALPGGAAAPAPAPPIDPFDYSYCGGEPVYPVIGYNFATFCGPRNQIGLGRRGGLVWLFPSADNQQILHRGERQLSDAELHQLSLLAEVAQLAEGQSDFSHPVLYDLGIDFAGRPYKRVHTALSTGYTPANALLHAMLAMIPDRPLLPDCANAPADFSPTLMPVDRLLAVQGNRRQD